MIAVAMPSVACTMSGESELGRDVQPTRRGPLAPRQRAAMTKSRSRSDSAIERARRA